MWSRSVKRLVGGVLCASLQLVLDAQAQEPAQGSVSVSGGGFASTASTSQSSTSLTALDQLQCSVTLWWNDPPATGRANVFLTSASGKNMLQRNWEDDNYINDAMTVFVGALCPRRPVHVLGHFRRYVVGRRQLDRYRIRFHLQRQPSVQMCGGCKPWSGPYTGAAFQFLKCWWGIPSEREAGVH